MLGGALGCITPGQQHSTSSAPPSREEEWQAQGYGQERCELWAPPSTATDSGRPTSPTPLCIQTPAFCLVLEEKETKVLHLLPSDGSCHPTFQVLTASSRGPADASGPGVPTVETRCCRRGAASWAGFCLMLQPAAGDMGVVFPCIMVCLKFPKSMNTNCTTNSHD